MPTAPRDVALIRLDNALRLFDEFVAATIKHPDAATLRGLERRFAERVLIQPSYWSQIKSRSRQIGERLARQFEKCCHKPNGWLDLEPGSAAGATKALSAVAGAAPQADDNPSVPRDDDERFIVGLVLTYYRRHPQRARTRLLDLLGEVLTPPTPSTPAPTQGQARTKAGATVSTAAAQSENQHAVWEQMTSGVAPLASRKKR